MKSIRPWLVGMLAFLVLGGVVAGMVVMLEAPPTTVREVIWDKQPCKDCGMSVSVPAFAAQLQTVDGEIYDFDDPGCLFLYVLRAKPNVHAAFFHAMEGEKWLSADEVGFVPTDRSPMDFGWGAVKRGEVKDAITYEEALERFRKIRYASERGGE